VKFREADRPLYRIGRKPDAWAWPDWLRVAVDGTFGNRWDDLLGSYRVLYAASTPLGAFVDALARFRPDPLSRDIFFSALRGHLLFRTSSSLDLLSSHSNGGFWGAEPPKFPSLSSSRFSPSRARARAAGSSCR
jgi:hypothetical protein